MIVFPPAKINLGLHVLARRRDGYHRIETCFYPIPIKDILEVIPARRTSFTSSGIPVPGVEEDNLCLRAYRLLKQKRKLPPVQVYLHKQIPTGAGLGGGSSDAAYVLRALDALFGLQLSPTHLRRYASALGSDCAFFTQDAPMFGEGKGNLLRTASQIDLTGYTLLLVKPPLSVSTAEAYARIAPATKSRSLRDILKQPLPTWKKNLINDFEPSVFAQYPYLEELKEKLYTHDALYAAMSGSGSAMYGIFKHPLPSLAAFKKDQCWQLPL